MQLEDYFNFLAPNDIRLKGTRIGIETILYDFIYKLSPIRLQIQNSLLTDWVSPLQPIPTLDLC